ncbi:hypothetical protein J6590_098404 [Homalodisca vitripennis]|nr:hypothetical protein J6590_098404 [Homalodisca vitripennis]
MVATGSGAANLTTVTASPLHSGHSCFNYRTKASALGAASLIPAAASATWSTGTPPSHGLGCGCCTELERGCFHSIEMRLDVSIHYNRPNEGITPCNGLSNRPSRLSLERFGIWQRFPVPVPASWESYSVKIFSGATTWRDSSSPQAPVHYLWSGADYKITTV